MINRKMSDSYQVQVQGRVHRDLRRRLKAARDLASDAGVPEILRPLNNPMPLSGGYEYYSAMTVAIREVRARIPAMQQDYESIYSRLNRLLRAAEICGHRLMEMQSTQRNGPALQCRPNPAADRLLRVAVRLLPHSGQERWQEELAAELLQLAEAKTSRANQVRHSLRLLVRVPALRRSLSKKRRASW